MRTFDLSPLFATRLASTVSTGSSTRPSTPPTASPSPHTTSCATRRDKYRISLAVAGYGENELEINQEDPQP